MTEQNTPPPLSEEVTDDGVFQVVADSYDAVYAALTESETFNRIWRTNAYQDDFPPEFAHIGFLTTGEARQIAETLGLDAESTLVDLACGGGGPGLWMAKESGASLIGVDPATAGLALATARARRVGLDSRAKFRRGTFAATGLADSAADAAMSIEAFQYAPDKSAALSEIHRVLRPGGRLAIVAFEVDPTRVTGIPVLGVDPVPDYRPLLEAARYELTAYEETPGWEDRVYAAFQAILDNADQLTAEMGEAAAGGAITEATVTMSLRPYPRRVLACALRDN
jgi:ubiquinone/menaquinone biosynthesis C-methylase UbiE